MDIKKDFPLSQILWYKIGGKAKYLLEAQNKEEIIQALDFIEKNKVSKFFILGHGSNLLFSDDEFDGAVIRIVNKSNPLISIDNEFVHVFAGDMLDSVIQIALKNNLTGLEWGGGLPGTMGAAVRGNVGAFGGELQNVFYEAEILQLRDDTPEILKFKRHNLDFSYRGSIIKRNKKMIVISATLELEKAGLGKTQKARSTYFKNIDYRKANHPLNYPNSGSIFKNITREEDVKKILEVFPDLDEKVRTAWHGKVSMGYLIRKLGLSNFHIGGATVSNKHCNFIVNTNNATFMDVLTIIRAIQRKFEDTFGISAETEIEIVE